ncbi:type II toxin-antitoxin system RelE family toxin [Methanobrevibacter curvatus]|uniref:type II toxin-antitoxin system RelE family toxin n=1 Tax=Methanobrevibacter curvatus TaxID=49547 RepID=UPI00082AC58C|nr:type II toxin-antitoxin system RelE/ParE family toxin [Methanobrevibacter curvatus]
MKKDTYNITLTPSADKYLKHLSKRNKDDVKRIIDTIKEIPDNQYNYKSLEGKFKGAKRARTGDYRIIFTINKKNKPFEIRIHEIGLRKNIYK